MVVQAFSHFVRRLSRKAKNSFLTSLSPNCNSTFGSSVVSISVFLSGSVFLAFVAGYTCCFVSNLKRVWKLKSASGNITDPVSDKKRNSINPSPKRSSTSLNDISTTTAFSNLGYFDIFKYLLRRTFTDVIQDVYVKQIAAPAFAEINLTRALWDTKLVTNLRQYLFVSDYILYPLQRVFVCSAWKSECEYVDLKSTGDGRNDDGVESYQVFKTENETKTQNKTIISTVNKTQLRKFILPEIYRSISLLPPLEPDLESDFRSFARIAIVTDTHGFEDCIQIPSCDVLLHCGDVLFTSVARPTGENQKPLDKFKDWWYSVGKRRARNGQVIIGGNHDSYLDARETDTQGFGFEKTFDENNDPKVVFNDGKSRYLENEFCKIQITTRDQGVEKNGNFVENEAENGATSNRFLSIFGSPVSCGNSHNSGFQSRECLRECLDNVKECASKYISSNNSTKRNSSASASSSSAFDKRKQSASNNNMSFVNNASLCDIVMTHGSREKVYSPPFEPGTRTSTASTSSTATAGASLVKSHVIDVLRPQLHVYGHHHHKRAFSRERFFENSENTASYTRINACNIHLSAPNVTVVDLPLRDNFGRSSGQRGLETSNKNLSS